MARPKRSSGASALGVDVGGVIIWPARERGDTSFFSSGYLETPAVAGALEAVARLNAEVFPGAVHIVSKARSETAHQTLEWFEHHGFHAITGVPPERIHFCENREDKAPIARRLGLTAFVDDRVDVLRYMADVPTRVLFAAEAAWVPDNWRTSGAKLAVGWREALAHLEEPHGR